MTSIRMPHIWTEILAGAIGLALIVAASVGGSASSLGTSSRAGDEGLIPPRDLKLFVLGYNEIASDSLWLRVIQNIDRCGKNFAVAASPNATPLCDKGWVFRHLDAMTELTPRFRAPYIFGAPALSVLINDREGARLIYDKGVAAYPNDWKVLLGAGYHALLELGDTQKAADLLVRAGQSGAPPWVFALAGRLYTESGKAVLAKVVLTEALKMVEDDPTKEKATRRIREKLEAVDKVLEGQEQAP